MRLHSIQPDESFREFVETPFQAKYQESVLERWLAENPNAILEDGVVLIIGRQVQTNLGTYIDLFGIDRQGDVVVVELKRDRTPRETLAQALEYASFAEALDLNQLQDIFRSYSGEESSLADYHRGYFKLQTDEAVAFNKDQRIVLVGSVISTEVRQTALFLRRKGIRVTCLEFGLFEAEGGQKILSSDIVVGRELEKIRMQTSSLPKITRQEFLDSLDENGRSFFEQLLVFADKRSYPIHWGTNGFSMNIDLNGTHIALCLGYRPESVYGQSIYTALFRTGGLASKSAAPEAVAVSLMQKLLETGLVSKAGRELKIVIDRKFSENEVQIFHSWLDELAKSIQEHGLSE